MTYLTKSYSMVISFYTCQQQEKVHQSEISDRIPPFHMRIAAYVWNNWAKRIYRRDKEETFRKLQYGVFMWIYILKHNSVLNA